MAHFLLIRNAADLFKTSETVQNAPLPCEKFSYLLNSISESLIFLNWFSRADKVGLGSKR